MSTGSELSLFRPEVAEARKQRVDGEIVLTHPLGTEALVLLISGIAIALGAWVGLGTYMRTETAPGLLVTDKPSAKIVAIRPGVVTELPVREGELVRAGQRLAKIDVDQTGAGDGGSEAVVLGSVDAQRNLTLQQVRLAERRESSERARLSATIAGLRQQADSLRHQISLQQEAVASAEVTVERIEGVVAKGFVSRLELERRRQALIAARQELERLQQQLESVLGQEASSAAELSRTAVDREIDVASARGSAESISQRRAQIEGEHSYSITAPVGGRVAALQAGLGRAVDPGIPLMEIVPEPSQLHAEIYAPTRAIGFVRPGQEVRLLYDAFPYERFGSFRGIVVRVSKAVLDPRQIAQPLKFDEPVYRIEVIPATQQLNGTHGPLRLQPGMTLRARIILERRSFIGWLSEPLQALAGRNGGK